MTSRDEPNSKKGGVVDDLLHLNPKYRPNKNSKWTKRASWNIGKVFFHPIARTRQAYEQARNPYGNEEIKELRIKLRARKSFLEETRNISEVSLEEAKDMQYRSAVGVALYSIFGLCFVGWLIIGLFFTQGYSGEAMGIGGQEFIAPDFILVLQKFSLALGKGIVACVCFFRAYLANLDLNLYQQKILEEEDS